VQRMRRRLHQVHDVPGAGRSGICHGAYIVRPWLWRCIACDVRNAGFGVEKIEATAVQRRPFSKRFEEIVGEACESAGRQSGGAGVSTAGDHGYARSTCATWNGGTSTAASRP